MGNAGFGSRSTAAEVVDGVDLSGKTFVVTGANSGIGKESARVLAQAGATVVLGCRSLERGERAAAEIGCPERTVVLELDLASIASVDAFAAAVNAADGPAPGGVDCVLCNGGIMAPGHATTADGFEAQWGTNHLGHFALVQQLLPALRAAVAARGGARVITVSSLAHLAAPLGIARAGGGEGGWFPPWRSAYLAWPAYGLSKHCNVAHAAELQRRYGAEGIAGASLHPGVIKTALHQNSLLATVAYHGAALFLKSVAQGAATQVLCATRPDLVGGGFYADCQPAWWVRKDALSEELGSLLWTRSEELCAQARAGLSSSS